MISFDRREALRYMGYHGAEPDAAVAESLERCAAELQTAVQPKSISARFPLPFSCAAIFPAVVVFPTPFTPIRSKTEFCFSNK